MIFCKLGTLFCLNNVLYVVLGTGTMINTGTGTCLNFFTKI